MLPPLFVPGTDILQVQSSNSDTDNTGAIIGGIVAVVFILLVMVIVMVILLMFRRQGANFPAKTKYIILHIASIVLIALRIILCRGSVDVAATSSQTLEFSDTSEATYQ